VTAATAAPGVGSAPPAPDTAAPDTAAPDTAAPDTAAPATAAPPGRRHLYQVDVVRLLTFVCVIGVHAIPMTTNGQSGLAGVPVTLLHFTRNAFFLLSAFVLVHSQARRPVRVGRFWPRRFLFVGVPYLVWTVVYWWIGWGRSAFSAAGLRGLGIDAATGTADYHLYFLLVSMQLYLLFPLLLWLLRRTAGHHAVLFAVSLALELAVVSLAHWTHWPGGWGALQAHDYALLPTYQFYFVAGGLAAVHFQGFHAWVIEHTRAVIGLLAGAAVLQIGSYALQLAVTHSPGFAVDPLQPSTVLESLAVTVGLYALGCRYARRRRPDRRLARFVDRASLVSFGVFLVHPLVLNTLLGRWLTYGATPVVQPVAAALAWGGTLLLSFVFAEVAVRTPAALPLTGRRRLPVVAA
jgi:peptidoglycan/LPS O-acetylase OafA/YrhL